MKIGHSLLSDFLKSWRFVGRLMLGLLVASNIAFACSVPVFRYALERWTPDAYNIVVFHKGEISEADQALIESTDSKVGKSGGFANAETHSADLDTELSPDMRELWKAQNSETLPWMVVLNPKANRSSGTVWAGLLEEESVARFVDSPIRREIARQLLAGTTAVWVLLEIGDAEKDDAAEKRLKSRLSVLETELKIGELDPQDIEDGLVSVAPEELKVDFSTIRVSRNDVSEEFFTRMLLESEDDLKEFEDPIVFPVFGQGRVLYALIGDGINNETIDETARFLVGPCSCQVKEQNPGTDLVFSVDWGNLVRPIVNLDVELPPLTGLNLGGPDVREGGDSGASAGEPRNIEGSDDESENQPRTVKPSIERPLSNPIVRNSMIVLLLTAVGGICMGFYFMRGK
ncbi:MAG: hypothetical protein O2960_18930 [Verrucomicrobia bacterium]|nr:hypothetical protein [Verrucomicrobiota bacterium]